MCARAFVRVRARVRACACVRACVRVCVRACTFVRMVVYVGSDDSSLFFAFIVNAHVKIYLSIQLFHSKLRLRLGLYKLLGLHGLFSTVHATTLRALGQRKLIYKYLHQQFHLIVNKYVTHLSPMVNAIFDRKSHVIQDLVRPPQYLIDSCHKVSFASRYIVDTKNVHTLGGNTMANLLTKRKRALTDYEVE